MKTKGTGELTESVQEFQQQFQCYKDRFKRRLQELEDLIEVAAQKMEILQKKKIKKKGVTALVDPFAKLIKEENEAANPLYDEEGSKDFDCELQLADFGIGCKAQEWPNLSEEFPDVPQETYTVAPIFDEDPEESHKCWLEQVCLQTKACEEHIEMVDSLPQVELRPLKLEGGEVFDSIQECEYQLYAQPIYDEYPSEGMECGPEHELILAALGGNHLHSAIFLQPELCTSESLEEQDIQDSPQRNVPPEDNMYGNNFSEKLEKKGLSPFINENGIYHRVENPYEMGMLTNEVVYELQPMLMAADASSLELNDFSSLVHCSFSEPKGVEVGRPYNMELMSKAKHTHGGKLNCKGVDFFEAVCKINSKDSSTATHSYGLDRSYIKFEEQNSKGNFTDAKGLECTSALKSDDNEGLEVPMELESPKPKDLPATIMQGEEWRWQQPIPYSHFYCLDKKSCKFSREEVLIFDPGGSMQDSWSKSVMKLVVNQQQDSQQDCLLRMTTENPVKSLVNSSNKMLENGGEPRFADFKSDYQGGGEQDAIKEESSSIFTMEKASLRGGHSSDHSKGHCPNLHSRKTVIYIFDPGGKKLEGARATMRTWLIFKRGGLSGTAPD